MLNVWSIYLMALSMALGSLSTVLANLMVWGLWWPKSSNAA